jgi:hypothetical protein
MIEKDGSTKNRVKNLHKSTIKMLLFASAMVELPTSSCHGGLYSRYYEHVGTFSSKPPGGSRGEVLLCSRVWKGYQWDGH